jgi:membrane protein DedA with SNARE-associated domain
MPISLQQTVALLMLYKYALLFPLSIIEGPIVTVIGGFLASLHAMNLLVVYCIVLAGDFVGDTSVYVFGRWGGNIFKKHGFRIGVTHERLEVAKVYFANHHNKALIASKLFHGIGVSGLVAAGILKIPYMRFARTCLLISILQSAAFLIIGIFFGRAYEQISLYVNNYTASISIIFLIILTLVIFLNIKNKKNLKP